MSPKKPTGGHEPTSAEFSHFIHLARHALLVERNEKPGFLLVDCWFFHAVGVPAWAEEAALAGAPPSTWCPWVNPALGDRPGDASPGR